MTGVTTHISFDLPAHARDMQQPIEKKFLLSIYDETANHRNSWKASFGS